MTESSPTVRLETEAASAWNDFVEASNDATLCHRWEWGPLFRDVFGHEPLYLSATGEDGATAGVLPLVRMRSRLTGHHLVSVPFINSGGPIGSSAACAALVAATLEEARRGRVDRVELRCRHRLADGLAPGREKVAVRLELPREPEELWSAWPSKLRSQIRRPQKAGMEVRLGLDQAVAFYEVYARNMRDLGTPVHPRRFFDEVAARFGDHVVFAAVYRSGSPVAAGCGFVWRNTFELTWASALREHSRQAPNMLLYWGCMEAMIRRGIRVFDFGRCTPGEGSHRFKLQWGGAEQELPWMAWSRHGDASSAQPGAVLQAGRATWRRLPLWVANRLGPRIAPALPWF